MTPDDFSIVVTTEQGARAALVAVWKAAMAAEWVVVGDYDLSGILSDDRTERDVKSIDICKSELARPFAQAEMRTALCMPCNVLIYVEDGVTKLATLRPSVVLPQLFEDASRSIDPDLPRQIDAELEQIVTEAAAASE